MITTSRRKQTKPIRVYDDYNFLLSMPPTGEPFPFPNGNKPMPRDNIQQDDMPMDLHVSIISCSKCPETFPTQEDLAQHVNAVHKKAKILEISKEEEKSYLTAYHRLGQEFQQETTFLNGHNGDQTVPVAVTSPTEQPYESENKELESTNRSDGSRIFHQDAFCDLCDREFCNKYFLKTHKANKHGIYETSTSPFSTNSGSGSGQGSKVVSPEIPMQLPTSLKLDLSLPKTPTFPKVEQKISSTVKLEATKPEIPTPKPLCLEVKKEITPTKPLYSAISSTPAPTSSASTTSTPRLDMEDYCEICQKHFCNKYYLKKHKQDVHGIIPENPSTPQSGKRRHISPMDLQSASSVVTSSQMILPQSVMNMGLPSLPNMPGVMVLNPFMPPVTLIPAQTLLSQQQVDNSSMISQSLPICSLSESLLSSSAPSSAITTLSSTSPPDSIANLGLLSKSLSSATNDAHGGMGMLNAEAYCEMCRKEFCNKYFLKIHRANKHGIFTDDMFPLPFGMSPEAFEASMMVTAKMPHDIKSEPGLQMSPNSIGNSDSQVTFCNMCNKEFSSKYSYKIHRMNVHGMLNEHMFDANLQDGSDMPMLATDLSSSEGLLKVAAEAHAAGIKAASGVSGGSADSSAFTFGNMIAAKLADRVICDICNKELTNKYFLKAHKLRVHGIDLSPQEKAAEAAAAAVMASGKQSSNLLLNMKAPLSGAKDHRDLSIITAEMITQDILQRSQTLNLSKKQHDLSNLTAESSTEKPSNNQLVKLGIDPEAYCEICKKEFCSKYFLRTHKLNIHGIRSERPDDGTIKNNPTHLSTPKNILPKSSISSHTSIANSINSSSNFHGNMLSSSLFSMAGFSPFSGQGMLPGFPGLPGMPHLPGLPGLPNLNLNSSPYNGKALLDLKEQMKETQNKEASKMNSNKEYPLNLGNNNTNNNQDSFEKHTWRWKEPANSFRVSCEICNKELCNKYFLRTHKLNKHGIVPSVGSNSPAPSDCETASNASSTEKAEMNVTDKNGPTFQTAKVDRSPLPSPVIDKASNLFKPTQLFKFRGDDELVNNRGYNSLAEICNICDRRFKNEKWLKAHMLKDHGGWPMMDMYKYGRAPLPMEGTILGVPDPKTCHVCGLLFPSELSMQLHLIQEHNAQVTLKEDGDHSGSGDECHLSDFGYGLGFKKRVYRSNKQKMFVCLFCNFNTKWLSNLCKHEESIHNIAKNSSSNKCVCQICSKSFPSRHLMDLHVTRVHNGSKQLGISSGTQKWNRRSKRVFRCVLCKESFPSRISCNKHLREVHIRSLKDFSPQLKSKHSCSFCKFSTFHPKLLQRHVARFHDETSLSDYHDLQDADQALDMSRKEAVFNNVEDKSFVQCFNLDVSMPNSVFLPAVAKMPVRAKVDEAMAVTFVLTPVNP